MRSPAPKSWRPVTAPRGERLVAGDVGGRGGKALELDGTADAVGAEDAADENSCLGHVRFGVIAQNGWIRRSFPHIRRSMSSAISSAVRPFGPIPFRKMNGLGNDFVVLRRARPPLAIMTDQARAIADRKTGIGCDQLIVLEQSPTADVTHAHLEREGFEVESCGNASRCIADMLFDEQGKYGTPPSTPRAASSRRDQGRREAGHRRHGCPRFDWKEIPLSRSSTTRAISSCRSAPSMRRCCTRRRSSMSAIRIAFSGSMTSMSSTSPRSDRCSSTTRCSRSVPTSRWPGRSKDHAVILKVWERGAGLTKACGTAACAVMAAGYRLKQVQPQVPHHAAGW
jgi:diaminopimelate epimerase